MPEDFTPQDGENGSSAFDEFLARYLDGERARATRSIDLTRFLSLRTQEFLQQAGAYALERGQRELDALHVLRVLVGESPAKDAVERVGGDAGLREDLPRGGVLTEHEREEEVFGVDIGRTR